VRGITREVTLDTRYAPAQGTGSGRRIKLTLTAPLNRREFGLVWNKAVINVADDLTLTVTCSGEDVALLIGRHGQTIDAVQYPLNAI